MRRITNFQWSVILTTSALIVFLVGATSLYFKYYLPNYLSEDINDSTGTWAWAMYWVLHTPLIFILSRRVSFERLRLTKSLIIYLSAGIFWAMFIQGLPLLVLIPFMSKSAGYNDAHYFEMMRNWFGSNFLPNVLVYWLVLSLCLISSYYQQFQNEKLRASQLDAQLSSARLHALQMQLQPHFLFNTLHSISALALDNEIRDAVKMINRLSELLRLTLDKADVQIVSLADEIELMRRYLEIERIRFQDRLSVNIDVEPQTLSAQVPTLILQPLVENAMRHAVDANAEASRIQIAVSLQNQRLLLEVRDDGKNSEKISRLNGNGLGLKNTRARLSELYGEDYEFSLKRAADKWTVAQINIPFLPVQEVARGESN